MHLLPLLAVVTTIDVHKRSPRAPAREGPQYNTRSKIAQAHKN